ncbi:MAG: CBS domain-containing protein [Candidatus Neomarinimicrobiota bacterium]
MPDFLNDEFQQMNELESEEEKEIPAAISVKDPLSSLDLDQMVTVERGTTVEKAIKLFQSEAAACVLVVDDRRLVGIFTERDVIKKLVGKGLDHSKEIVDNYMTADPDVLKNDDPVAFALNRMTDGGYRHVPIVDDNGMPIGLVGILDIVKQLASYYSDEVLNLPPEPLRGPQVRPEGG